MTFQQIRKRDGRIVAFDSTKITRAILKAGKASGQFDLEMAQQLSREVVRRLALRDENHTPEVEAVQDIVETVLMESPFKRTAKAYVIYREQHARIREVRSIISRDMINGYLNHQDWRVNENSNMSYSIQGLNNYVSATITAQYWLNTIYPREIREAHQNGDFHIHDLGILAVYCVGWDLCDLLLRGFKGASGKVESKPARHFRSALGQVVNFFYTLQGEAAGAQAFSNFDTYLAPFIRYDNLSYQEVKQALQEFVFNVNVPTRVGFQTPFSNVTLDLSVPNFLKDEAVIIGGEYQEFCYKDFDKELDLFNRAFAEVMFEGDARGRAFTFPIPTYNITKDFDWDNPNLKPIWEMTAKYGIPYFSNFINSDMKPEDARSMCCRLRIDNRDLQKRGGGLFGANPLTGSIGVVTINFPRLGYLSQSHQEFFSRLGHLMDLAKESLETKRKVLEKFTENGLYPYARFYLSTVKQRFGQYWQNHFATIGLVGMNEALLNFLGKDIGTREGRAFAIEILNFMRDRLMDYQLETNSIYNLEATPAEGASYRLARIDQQKFRAIRSASESDEPYYTNSSQLPVNYTDDIFEALLLQDDLQTRYTGGTVFHTYLGERLSDPEAAKLLVRKIAQSFRLPYFTLTPVFSVCPNHGYLSGEVETCPKCSSECEIYSRVVGYLRPVKQWNRGKKEEFRMRRAFRIGG